MWKMWKMWTEFRNAVNPREIGLFYYCNFEEVFEQNFVESVDNVDKYIGQGLNRVIARTFQKRQNETHFVNKKECKN